MKIVSGLMISVILVSVLFLPSCAPQGGEEESVPILSLSLTTGTYDIGDRCELAASFVTPEGEPFPFDTIISVRFEMAENSFHHPSNLMEDEFYEWEVCEWVEAAMYEGYYLRPLISEHWKREKVYSNSANYVYCSTGSGGEPAKWAYWGIYMGNFPGIQTYTDTIVVSASVGGHELEETATITWHSAGNTCVLDLTNNTLSPTNSVVTPVEPLGDGEAVVEIDMGAGNYSVLEMKIEIQAPSGGWLLNIGNSPTNDGAGGDYGDFANDSELDVYGDATYPNFILQLYANQYFSTPGAVVANLVPLFNLQPTPTPVLWILRIKIADQKMCALVENTGALRGDPDNPAPESPYVFRLGGPDNEANGGVGPNDYKYYAAFNRVIYTDVHPDRTGSGVTKVTFEWRTTWPGWEIP